MRREVPLIITSIAGLVFAISYFVPMLGETENLFGDWVSIVQAFAVWLGLLNLSKVSLDKIYRKREGWQYSALTLVGLVVTLTIGFWSGITALNDPNYASFRDAGLSFDWVFRWIYTPLTSTMFSMLAFFVASASYRAFRARNFEATLLLIAAFFVMGGRVPLFDMLVNWVTGLEFPIFSTFADWIMTYPNTAGQRAIMIGIALGIMSSSLRIILGLERSLVGGGGR